MKPFKAYKYCLRCSRNLDSKSESLLICSNCDFHYFISPAVCNGVVIEDDSGRVLLVKRRYPPKKGYWDMPGGFIEPYESYEHSVLREIKEELGVVIRITKIIGIYEDVYEYQNIEKPTMSIVVAAKIIKGEITPKDDLVDYKFFSKDEAFRLRVAFKNVTIALKDYFSK